MRGAAPKHTAPMLLNEQGQKVTTLDKGPKRYYENLGRACDLMLRCVDCQRLVTVETLRTRGTCPCGCRRLKEITTLGLWEWIRIRLGFITFPDRKLFLAEFPMPWTRGVR